VFAFRYADVPQARARYRFTGDYNVTDRLQLGFEYNPAVGELGFRGTYLISRETDQCPMVHLNTSSDRIGTPPGYQQVSLNFAKAIPNTPLAPYASVTYSGYDRTLVFPFGLSLQLNRNWNLVGMYDGRRSHLLAAYTTEQFFVQLGWIWLRHPAIAVGFGF
jgi:hypothetical protein